ncbi:MAG: hypothetical protein EZS28_037742 [Streblomastix strix]|uniref:Uncharacterized protein n=1 Tax=Streblomastix strix TaxID=222440 RepID=A0A5J4UA09_9EUKA|nr:MAG: hypothetical protein EZS28_037742 [Streblomastix strix]
MATPQIGFLYVNRPYWSHNGISIKRIQSQSDSENEHCTKCHMVVGYQPMIKLELNMSRTAKKSLQNYNPSSRIRQYHLLVLESIVFATYTISRGGIVDSSCIPNTKQPEDITQCEDKSVPLVYLKQSEIGRFYESDSAAVKQLLLRFGVVQIQEKLIIRWENSNWIYADRGTDKYLFLTLAIDSKTTKFEGRVIVAESDELIDCLIRPNDPFCINEKEDQTWIIKAAFCLIAGALILPALNLQLWERKHGLRSTRLCKSVPVQTLLEQYTIQELHRSDAYSFVHQDIQMELNGGYVFAFLEDSVCMLSGCRCRTKGQQHSTVQY